MFWLLNSLIWSVAEHLSFLLILTEAVSRYPAPPKIRPPHGINWHIFKTQQGKWEPKQTFAIGKMLLKAGCTVQKHGMAPKMSNRLALGISVWSVALLWVLCAVLHVGFFTCGVSLLPREHPSTDPVMQQRAAVGLQGVNLWLLYAAYMESSVSRVVICNEIP